MWVLHEGHFLLKRLLFHHIPPKSNFEVIASSEGAIKIKMTIKYQNLSSLYIYIYIYIYTCVCFCHALPLATIITPVYLSIILQFDF